MLSGMLVISIFLLTVLGRVVSGSPAIAHASSVENAIVRENRESGDAEWYSPITRRAEGPNGFATNMSILPSQRITFKVDYHEGYSILIYRLGYYNGTGGRLYANITVEIGTKQPPCNFEAATRMTDCGNWKVSAFWDVPVDATTGVYIGVPISRSAALRGTYIPFVVRQAVGGGAGADLLFKTADTTWVAYNMYGGWNLYRGNGSFSFSSRAVKASYNRPFFNRLPVPRGKSQNFLFGSEYAFLYWLEKHGYSVAYTSSIDIDNLSDASTIKQYKVLLSVGHDEYWSQKMKSVYENAREYGINLGFFSGNEVFWRILWDGQHNRVLVCRKESMDRVGAASPEQWTGTFQDPRFRPADPQNALTGQLWMVNGMRKDSLKVSRQDASLRFWRNTAIMSKMVRSGGGRHHYNYVSPAGVLGYEWDEFTNDCSRPFGAFTMSSSSYHIIKLLNQEYGTSFYGNGTATHKVSTYRHFSTLLPGVSSLVFGAGTIQWTWALSSKHDGDFMETDSNLQQATMNVLADMSALPSTMDDPENKRQSALVMPVASTDSTPPKSAIAFPQNGSTMSLVRNSLLVSGNATDFGGGQVAAVYVSVDGSPWDLARGRGYWSYTIAFNTSSNLHRCRQQGSTASASNYSAAVSLVMAL